MASRKRTLLTAHPDPGVQAAYSAYKAAIAAAGSQTAREEAARQGVENILTALRATGANAADYPRASAPGAGDIQKHGNKGSSVREGSQVWWLESEHVLPFDTGKTMWRALDLYLPERGWPEDDEQTTVMIYYRAARIKTADDLPLSQAFASAVEGLGIADSLNAAVARLKDGDSSALDDGREVLGKVLNPLRALSADAVSRTVAAIEAENREQEPGFTGTNAERRGAIGKPEPPWPVQDKVEKAAKKQYDDVLRLVRTGWVSRDELRERLHQRGLIN
jgi:hypothetical protein